MNDLTPCSAASHAAPASPVTDPWAHVESIVRRSGTSFYWAMRLLPEPKRRAMFAVYAFCREVDDIADEPAPMAEKVRGLTFWREEVARLYAGEPVSDPIAVALKECIPAFGMHERDFLAVIEGMEMDAGETLVISDMDELELYCDRVACAVGRLSCRVFGVEEAQGDRVAHALGQALQLTNILRDVAEDAERDRLYLPVDLLVRHGAGDPTPANVLTFPGLPSAMAEISDLADRRFKEARAELARCDKRQMRPSIIMMEVYHRIYRRLVARGWDRVAEPVGLSKAEKLLLALRFGLF